MFRSNYVIVAFISALGLVASRSVAEDTALVEPSQVIEYEPRGATDRPPVITAVAVLPGGGIVATAGDDHIVRLWSTTTGRIVSTLKGHRDWVRALAFSPDGRLLASGGDDRQIVLWRSEEHTSELQSH